MKKKSLRLTNDETYYYIERGTSNEVLILIHGNMSSGVHFKPLIELLETEYKIIAPDLRGFGDSSYNVAINSLEDLSDDIYLLMEELNIEKAHILGWSTGGAIAMKFAAKYKEMCEKLILVESASFRGYPVFKKNELGQPIIGETYSTKEELALDAVQVLPIITALRNNDVATMKSIWDIVIYNVNNPSLEDDKLYLSETMKQRNLVDIDWCLTSFNMSNYSNGVSEGDDSIKDVRAKTLSLWGDSDIVVLESMIDETVNALSDAKKIILENSGHSPMVDCPEELAKLISEFIE
ncbi:alpha/beta hydrolase [Mycoplasmatota bacterium zrk1]